MMGKNHTIRTALAMVALLVCASQAWAVSGGTVYIDTIEGPQATSVALPAGGVPAGNPGNLPTLVIQSPAATDQTLVYLRTTPTNNIPGAHATPPFNDTHIFTTIVTTATDLGTGKVLLGFGDPKGTGIATGSVNLELYTAGTAAGADPSTAANRNLANGLEAIWKQVQQPGSTKKVGIFLDGTVVNPARNGLGMRLTADPFTAKYLALREMLVGDITTAGLGDGKVNSFDVNQAVNFLGKAFGYNPGGPGTVVYNYFTWLEGDVTTAGLGAGKVNSFDINAIVNNLGQTYNPNNGGLVPLGGGGTASVPEPGTWALLISGIIAIFLARRLTGLQRSVK